MAVGQKLREVKANIKYLQEICPSIEMVVTLLLVEVIDREGRVRQLKQEREEISAVWEKTFAGPAGKILPHVVKVEPVLQPDDVVGVDLEQLRELTTQVNMDIFTVAPFGFAFKEAENIFIQLKQLEIRIQVEERNLQRLTAEMEDLRSLLGYFQKIRLPYLENQKRVLERSLDEENAMTAFIARLIRERLLEEGQATPEEDIWALITA